LVITGKVAVVLPPGTVTLDGTFATPVLLLDRLTTTRSFGAGAVSVTVPVEEPPPVTVEGSRLNAERYAASEEDIVIAGSVVTPDDVDVAAGVCGDLRRRRGT